MQLKHDDIIILLKHDTQIVIGSVTSAPKTNKCKFQIKVIFTSYNYGFPYLPVEMQEFEEYGFTLGEFLNANR